MINTRVKQAREESNISQVAMAEKMGVARQTYLDIESGKNDPKISYLMKVCDITDVSLSWLVSGNEEDKLCIDIQKNLKEARELIERAQRLLGD